MAGGEALQTTEFSTVSSASPETKPELTVVNGLKLDRTRDALLTEFGKKTLEDRYLLAGESYQDMFARVATASHAGAGPDLAVDDEQFVFFQLNIRVALAKRRCVNPVSGGALARQ